MKQRTVSSTLCLSRGRLDSHYYLAPGVAARDKIAAARAAGIETWRLGGAGGLAEVWQPSRFKRAYAADGEAAVAYLRPYDVFEYLPSSADLLSIERTEDLGNYRLSPGMILQTCSGRNLGPLTVADEYLSGFVLSHDMVRVELEDPQLAGYVYAFLSSSLGQAMLRQRMSGSVVDHLTTDDVADLEIPLIEDLAKGEVAQAAGRSLELMARARLDLNALRSELRINYPVPQREERQRNGWSVTSRVLKAGSRLDAHYHDPFVMACREQLRDAGGVRVADVAEAILPVRYTRYYVEPQHGRPIVSGRQLLQVEPVNLRYISDRSFKDPTGMVLEEGMVAFGAVGRWEGRLGDPALITADRHGWLASNDVMRLRPRCDEVEPGWLWLAVASEQVQRQIASLPYGSVIDHTGPRDVESEVWLPPADAELGHRARSAWEAFDLARSLKRQAVEAIESSIKSAANDRHASAQRVR